MKHLIIYAHPNPNSYCKAILKAAEDKLKSMGEEVRVRDLYDIGFDPILTKDELKELAGGSIPESLKEEQSHVAWADILTFIYPIWWGGPPSILRGYFDRVFSVGFAYTYGPQGPQGLLAPRKAIIVSTQGASEEDYQKSGMFDAMHKIIDEGTFGYCGIEVLKHRYLASVTIVDNSIRKQYLEEIKTLIETEVTALSAKG